MTPKEAYILSLYPDEFKGNKDYYESIIAKDFGYSYLYARNVLKGRFELGEKVIATSQYYPCLYAHNILKGRFELCEYTIDRLRIIKYIKQIKDKTPIHYKFI